jgi:hypothetical protein
LPRFASATGRDRQRHWKLTDRKANKKPPEGGFCRSIRKRLKIGAGEGIRTLDPNLGKLSSVDWFDVLPQEFGGG